MARRQSTIIEPGTEEDNAQHSEAGGESQGHTKVSSDGQMEMTLPESPLYEASENLVIAKARLNAAIQQFTEADEAWCEAMKDANKSKIQHKGDVIQFVLGKTSKDHSRFTKPGS